MDGDREQHKTHWWNRFKDYLLDPFVQRVGAIAGTLIATALTLFGWYRSTLIEQITEANSRAKSAEERLDKELVVKDGIKKRLDDQTALYDQLLAWQHMPFLQSPDSGATIIGSQIRFSWDYNPIISTPGGALSNSNSRSFTHRYQLMIRRVSGNTPAQELRFPVPVTVSTSKPSMHIAVSELQGPGVYLWRVVPTQMQDDRIIPLEDNSSRSSTFHVFKTTYDRICQLREVRVGTAPALVGRLHRFLPALGTVGGYDVALARELVSELEERLRAQAAKECDLGEGALSLKIVQLPFADLLPALQHRKIDLAISSMTASKQREDDNRGIQFSDSYLTVHQIVISAQSCPVGDIPQSLARRLVGVWGPSTNERAARYLQKQFRFDVKVKETFNDLYEALEQNEVDYAIVDDLVALEYLPPPGQSESEDTAHRFVQCGGPLDAYLKGWYEQDLRKSDEHYAVAAMVDPPIEIDHSPLGNQLITVVNDILRSLKKRHVLDRLRSDCLGDNFSKLCSL